MNFQIPFFSSSSNKFKIWGIRLAVLSTLSAVAVGVVISQTILPPLPPQVLLPAR